MFTTSSNPYTVKDINGNPILFKGCSNFIREVESDRLFQAEIYLCPKSKIDQGKIALSDYTFNKVTQYSKNMFICLKNSIEQYLMNSNYGIKSVHFYDETANIFNQIELLNSLYRLTIDVLNDDNYSFPTRGIVNCDFRQYRKNKNSNNNTSHNKRIFATRFAY